MGINTKKESYKEYLRLERELCRVDEAQKELGYYELEKPVHNGYLAFFKLRDDVAKRENGDRLAELLEKYSTIEWSRNKSFTEKTGKTIRVIEPKLKQIREYDFNDIPSKDKEYFTSIWVKSYWNNTYTKHYVLDFPKYFMVIKKKKDYITHRKIISGELESEEQFLRDKIWEIRYKSNPYDDGSMKPYSSVKNRGERRKNKVKLKSNLLDLNDNFDLEDGLSYKHRNSAKWERW